MHMWYSMYLQPGITQLRAALNQPDMSGKIKGGYVMRKALIVTVAMLAIGSFACSVQADMKKGKLDAKAEFEEHCASCHPDGGNIINKAKPIDKKTLEKNGIKTWKDIVAKMRNPGPGMTKFDKKEIPDAEAKAIAVYI